MAYFDHIVLFDIDSNLTKADLAWISKKYIAFENSTVDFEQVHNFIDLKEDELNQSLSVYTY